MILFVYFRAPFATVCNVESMREITNDDVVNIKIINMKCLIFEYKKMFEEKLIRILF